MRVGRLGPAARAVYRGVRGGTHGFLSRFTNNAALYSNLDIKYLGPVDGHDLPTLIETLELAKSYGAPVIVHAITEKGRGYQPALDDQADAFHAVGKIDPLTGKTVGGSGGAPAWTDVFADELVSVGEKRDDIIAMTAAMLRPTGLLPFAQRFPDRVYDVGIAEQHAVASAAGLAFGGLHPVVAIGAIMAEPVSAWLGPTQAARSLEWCRVSPPAADGIGPAHGGFVIESAPPHPGLLASALPWEGGAREMALMEEARHLAPLIALIRDGGAGRVRWSRGGHPRIEYRVSGPDGDTARRAHRVHLDAGEFAGLAHRKLRARLGEAEQAQFGVGALRVDEPGMKVPRIAARAGPGLRSEPHARDVRVEATARHVVHARVAHAADVDLPAELLVVTARRRAVTERSHVLDEKSLALGEGGRERVVDCGRFDSSAVPQARRRRARSKPAVAGDDGQFGRTRGGELGHGGTIGQLTRVSIKRSRMSQEESRSAALAAARRLSRTCGA